MPMVLDVRLDGFSDPIGTLADNERGAVLFRYDAGYLSRPDAMALSLSLPLDDGEYGDVAARPYFDNLLQERDAARAEVIARYRIANDDIVGILSHLGKDCSGAVSIVPQGAPATKVPGDLGKDYVPLSEQRLAQIVRSLHERRALPEDVRDPSPLAGVQSKIALARLPDGRYAEPRQGSGAPTTHILKVPDQRHPRDALHEHHAMDLSRHLRFPTAATELIEVDGITVLSVERFDRDRDDAGRVTRRHQEDFCQALGLSSRRKYERRDAVDGFNTAAIGRILDETLDPALEKRRFVDQTVFDILIGNVDGHAKNLSLFHLPGNRLAMTPRYDVLPTMLDRGTTDEFAHRIGDAKTLQELDWEAMDRFLEQLGFASRAGRRRLAQRALRTMIAQLDEEIGSLAANRLKNFADLIATNIRTACQNLHLPVPAAAAGRDTFVR